MKLNVHIWQTLHREHVLFASYRWLAWLVACLAVSLAVVQRVSPEGVMWLLVLACTLNVVATTTARAYVRIVQRRIWLLGLDILIGVAMVRLSGGNWLPFMPYALGALVVPGLVLRWRTALGAALSFALLDLSAALTTTVQAGPEPMSGLLVRFVVPLAFVTAISGVRHLANMRQSEPAESIAGSTGVQVSETPPPLVVRDHFGPVAELPVSEHELDLAREAAAGAEILPLREVADRSYQDLRRAICSVTARPDVELAVALEQLVGNFNQNNGVEVHLSLIGRVQPLSLAQQMVMFRLAQESLLNVQQHARAHSAQLTLRYEPQTVSLTVQDDGVGLLDGTYERPGLHSLRAMYYRLAELDGKLQVYEGDSGGVVVCGLLPLDG